jgi:hypothetical protein
MCTGSYGSYVSGMYCDGPFHLVNDSDCERRFGWCVRTVIVVRWSSSIRLVEVKLQFSTWSLNPSDAGVKP